MTAKQLEKNAIRHTQQIDTAPQPSRERLEQMAELNLQMAQFDRDPDDYQRHMTAAIQYHVWASNTPYSNRLG